jgi:hypothetical protein
MNTGKMFSLLAIWILGVLAGSTLGYAQSDSSSAPPEIRKAILARMAEIQAAAESFDADKVFSFVLENNAGALAQNGRLFLTREEALESTKRGFQGLQHIEYKFDEQHITLLSPTVALAVGDGVSSGKGADGRTFSGRFAQSVIFVLTDGEWRVFHSHRSVAR